MWKDLVIKGQQPPWPGARRAAWRSLFSHLRYPAPRGWRCLRQRTSQGQTGIHPCSDHTVSPLFWDTGLPLLVAGRAGPESPMCPSFGFEKCDHCPITLTFRGQSKRQPQGRGSEFQVREGQTEQPRTPGGKLKLPLPVTAPPSSSSPQGSSPHARSPAPF